MICEGRFLGRIALVTGALRGIGRAVCERLAAEGAYVLATDLDAADSDLALTLPSGIAYNRLDVAMEEDWRSTRDAIQRDFGRLDILVNNAGIDLVSEVQDTALEEWRRLMRINVEGVFLGVKAFTDLLRQGGASIEGGASVINISSMFGLVGNGETACYNASKGAVRLFTKSVALQFAEKTWPIRVNSVHPGFIDTSLMEKGMERAVAQGKGADAAQLKEQLALAAPMGRLGRSDEIAAAVLFLASSDASFITGAELVADGGYTAR
ncbi:SDR family oxidoreductase [Sphingobium sp. TB-6]|uniref:SDR family oxidoreductase n=1 Tax=Sphingobium sp. TB-6 TaxID=2728850 RepID=UPI00146A7E8C|nr:SDR family oxidoreductase [Sphingobium sp. TB-6]NML90656.1 SDR family oxidoreductase [Sphingobium sp. TB-6]